MTIILLILFGGEGRKFTKFQFYTPAPIPNSCVASSVAGTRVMCHSVTTPDTKFGAFKLWILLELGPHEIRCSNSKPNQSSGMNTENPQTLSQAPPSQTGTF